MADPGSQGQTGVRGHKQVWRSSSLPDSPASGRPVLLLLLVSLLLLLCPQQVLQGDHAVLQPLGGAGLREADLEQVLQAAGQRLQGAKQQPITF